MDENKKIPDSKNDIELDVMVPESSKKQDSPGRTRAIPAFAAKKDASVTAGQDKKETAPVAKTAVDAAMTESGQKKRAIPDAKKVKADNVTQEDKEPEEKESGGVFSGVLKALLYIIGVIAISGVLSYYGIIFANDIFAFVKDDVSAEITVDENTTISELADMLDSEGLIEHPGVFKFYTWYRHRNNEKPIELNPGTYTVSSTLNYDMMLSVFKKKANTRTIVTLTFKEGLTVDETIQIFLDAGVGNRDEFIDAINNYDYDFKFVKALDNWRDIPGRKYRLEGYLYPDTYDFYADSDESFIISKLLSNFDQKFEEEYYDRCTALGYSVDDIINLASLIEKEGYLQEDLEVISSVFHNRLNKWENPYLQSDATIQYSFEERKKQITLKDLETDSLYNTYLYKGLPPSAIANPGLESILAALYPANTNYYYFVTRNNGGAIFSRTLGEHNNAKAKIASESNKQSAPERSEEALAETDNIVG